MSEPRNEGERLVERLVEAWNASDYEAAVSLVHPEVEWRLAGVYPDLRDVYEGHEGYREFWDAFLSGWEDFVFEPREVLTGPRSVLVLADVRGRAREGLEVEQSWGYLLQLEQGVIRRARSFSSWDEARAAADRLWTAEREPP